MKKSAFGLMIISAMAITACAPKPGGEVVTYYPKPTDSNGVFIAQKETTLFDLGRSLSNNRVDIFDPALPTFKIPPDDPKAANPLASFPAHPYMLIKDQDVTVFSMFSANILDVEEITSPPVPLTADESQLPP